uniref:Uncharacterized protein n=1 Tax=Phaeomonas parva TaxID=124430 RepID=A0A7S1U7Y6_9STRA|mmetsp:Transcript_35648/g.112035  ORF Transcript_35648/g.112035 Transcript_35648/m.112035 type:complete len:259 (+) Transcript_35648:1-777(+)
MVMEVIAPPRSQTAPPVATALPDALLLDEDLSVKSPEIVHRLDSQRLHCLSQGDTRTANFAAALEAHDADERLRTDERPASVDVHGQDRDDGFLEPDKWVGNPKSGVQLTPALLNVATAAREPTMVDLQLKNTTTNRIRIKVSLVEEDLASKMEIDIQKIGMIAPGMSVNCAIQVTPLFYSAEPICCTLRVVSSMGSVWDVRLAVKLSSEAALQLPADEGKGATSPASSSSSSASSFDGEGEKPGAPYVFEESSDDDE